jgi:hypothetical protein
VALSPMTSTFDDLDPIVDMAISSVGLLEPDLLTPCRGPRPVFLLEHSSSIQ